MHIHVNSRNPIARSSDSDFVVPLLVNVIAQGKFSMESSADDRDSEYVVGRLWAERLDWALGETLGFHPVQLCDAASATWLQVYETLVSKKRIGFRRDLRLPDTVEDLVFVHELLIHPEVPDRLPVLDAALRAISGSRSLLLMQYSASPTPSVSNLELRDLGFKKVVRNNLLLRDNHYRYPFADTLQAGRDVDFEATAEHEEWLLDQWDCLVADEPSL